MAHDQTARPDDAPFRWWGAGGVLTLAAITLLLAACGAPSTSATTGTTPNPSRSAPATAPGTNSQSQQFLSKLQSGEHSTFVATYRLVGGAEPASMTLTIAVDGSNAKFGVQSATGSNFEEISTAGGSVFCTQGAAGPWFCFHAAAGAGAGLASIAAVYAPGHLLTTVQAAVAAETSGGQITTSSRTLNGVSMSCLTLAGHPGVITGATYCITSQGVLGYAASAGPPASSMTLLSFSTSIPSGEFTPPATPQAQPSS
ncbi:MAG: hypothetical protein ACYDEA_12130 [Candidatus Dormibacteria bacterium]